MAHRHGVPRPPQVGGVEHRPQVAVPEHGALAGRTGQHMHRIDQFDRADAVLQGRDVGGGQLAVVVAEQLSHLGHGFDDGRHRPCRAQHVGLAAMMSATEGGCADGGG